MPTRRQPRAIGCQFSVQVPLRLGVTRMRVPLISWDSIGLSANLSISALWHRRCYSKWQVGVDMMADAILVFLLLLRFISSPGEVAAREPQPQPGTLQLR